MYFNYVLKSLVDGRLYYGFTKDLNKRLENHNKGLVKSTKGRAPFKLVYFEETCNIEDVRAKEKYFKSGFGRKYVKNKLDKLALSSNS